MIIKEERAIEFLNAEAVEIYNLLSIYKQSKKNGKKRVLKSVSHQMIAEISLDDAKDIIESQVNYEGKELSKYFYDKSNQKVGLDILNYKRFDKFVNQLFKRKEIRDTISREALVLLCFDWLRRKYCKEIDDAISFVQFFESEASSVIKKYKISIPIRFLEIDGNFKIGNVEFDFMKQEIFDNIEKKLDQWIKENRIPQEDAESYKKKLKKDYQGKVFATIVVTAELEKAIDIAETEVEKSLSALKFFSPPVFIPQLTAYFGRKGFIDLQESYLFIFENGLPVIRESVKDNTQIGFNVDHLTLSRMLKSGLENFSAIIKKEDITEFEELICNSIFTFSKALSKRSFHEKLTFVLSAAEISFLKDYTEPVQQNLGQRLAFFVFEEKNNRINVLSIIKKSYEIRSRFLHHGHELQDYSLLKELQLVVWKALNKMISMSMKFNSKDVFIKHIENILYS